MPLPLVVNLPPPQPGWRYRALLESMDTYLVSYTLIAYLKSGFVSETILA
jgi:hypothetical protein